MAYGACIFSKQCNNKARRRQEVMRFSKNLVEKEVIDLENYLKTVLYAYPLLKTVGEDYEQHIRNKAVLSYDGRWNTWRLAEYLAEEILQKNRLEWLKSVVEKVLDKLSDTERALVALRYFGKRRKRNTALTEGSDFPAWSDRKYFRMQQRTSEKVGGMLIAAGVTKAKFERELVTIEMIAKVHTYVENNHNSCS